MADTVHITGAPGVRPYRQLGGHPILQISPTDPLRLARTIPLSMWPVQVRQQLERRREGMERALRRLEDLREAMIDKLDVLTIDSDLEPSLGAGEHPAHLRCLPSKYFAWAQGAQDDREGDGDRWTAKDADFEPSLGASAAVNQRRWANGRHLDLEQEHDGREPECEDEGAQCDDEGVADCDICMEYADEHDQRLQLVNRLAVGPVDCSIGAA